MQLIGCLVACSGDNKSLLPDYALKFIFPDLMELSSAPLLPSTTCLQVPLYSIIFFLRIVNVSVAFSESDSCLLTIIRNTLNNSSVEKGI